MHVVGEWFDKGVCLFPLKLFTLAPQFFHDPPEDYRPERRLEARCNDLQRGFWGFSRGGRTCPRRNIAYFEMSLLIATLFSR